MRTPTTLLITIAALGVSRLPAKAASPVWNQPLRQALAVAAQDVIATSEVSISMTLDQTGGALEQAIEEISAFSEIEMTSSRSILISC